VTAGGDLVRLTAAETADVLARGEASALEVTEAHLARIEDVDASVRAFLHVDEDGARDALESTRSVSGGAAPAIADTIKSHGAISNTPRV
jgi:aspartyl-tRNA(Asn)/glutamyl-tRNA(Gln) amidotransferase subunit A